MTVTKTIFQICGTIKFENKLFLFKDTGENTGLIRIFNLSVKNGRQLQ